ncbi:hypothetical protein PHIN109289_18940 [Phaeobacter inhibens]
MLSYSSSGRSLLSLARTEERDLAALRYGCAHGCLGKSRVPKSVDFGEIIQMLIAGQSEFADKNRISGFAYSSSVR